MDATWDVFISYSAKDEAVVRPLAERLRASQLRVWFDKWEILPGDSIPAKIEEGLEHSRLLLLCMSAHALGSDWARLESGTFRFRDPPNKSRRFIPLRLDDAPAPGSLAQFNFVDWREGNREAEYQRLLAVCRSAEPAQEPVTVRAEPFARAISLGQSARVRSVALSTDGKPTLSGAKDNTLRPGNLESSSCLKVLEGHTARVLSVALGQDGKRALSGSADNTLRLWDLDSSCCLKVLESHTAPVWSVALSADGKQALSGALDNTVRLWDIRPPDIEGGKLA